MMKKIILTSLIFPLHFIAFSQLGVSLGGFYSTALDEFKQANYNDGVGFSVALSHFVLNYDNDISLEVGGEYARVGSPAEKVDIFLEGIEGAGEYSLSNKNRSLALFTRASHSINEHVRAYVGIKAGFRWFATKELISQKRPYNLEYAVETQEFLNEQTRGFVAPTFGALIQIGKDVFIDLGTTVNFSSGIDFIETETLNETLNEISFITQNSATSNLLFFHVGVHFALPYGTSTPSSGSQSTSSYTPTPSSNTPSCTSGGSSTPPRKPLKIKVVKQSPPRS